MNYRRMPSRFTDFVAAEAIAAIVYVGAASAGASMPVAIGTAAVVLALCATPFRGLGLPRWVVVGSRYLRGAPAATATLTTRADSTGRHSGVRWDGTRVSMVLECLTPPSGWTASDRAGCDPDVSVPLTVLAGCLARHDLGPVAIDVVSHGARIGPPSGAADVYERLVGPLSAVGVRTVWIVVSLDVTVTDPAIARRGGSMSAAMNAVDICSARVGYALRARGVLTRTLTSPEIARAAEAVTGGRSVASAVERWNEIDFGDGTRSARALDPTDLARSHDDAWLAPGEASTVVIHLRSPGAGGSVDVAAEIAVTAPAGTAPFSAAPVRSGSLAGRQMSALQACLPGSSSSGDAALRWTRVAREVLNDTVVPATGSGQVIGSDDRGRAVSVRLFGPARPISRIAAEIFVCRQAVFRAVALGACVQVVTDRAHSWTPLVDAIRDTGRLVVDGVDASPRPDADLVVFDGLDRAPSATSATVYLTDPSVSVADHPADVRIEQTGSVGDRILMTTGGQSIRLTLVTVGAEQEFIGRPRVAQSLTATARDARV